MVATNSKIALFQIADLVCIDHLQPTDWSNIKIHMLDYCLQSFCTPVKYVENSEIVGIGSLIQHESSAWLAHIIVGEQYRGMGIGATIVTHLLQLATAKKINSVSLIATDMGAPVYEKCGFKVLSKYYFMQKGNRYATKSLSPLIKPATERHKEQILTLDKKVSGESRSKLILNFINLAIVFERDEQVEGYYLPHFKEGPIYATTQEAGLALLDLKCNTADLIAIPAQNMVGIDHLTNLGFEKQDKMATRMLFGEDIAWQAQNIYSRIGGNYG